MKNFVLVNLALTMFLSISQANELDVTSVLKSINQNADVLTALADTAEKIGGSCDAVSNLMYEGPNQTEAYAYALCGKDPVQGQPDLADLDTDRMVHVYATISQDRKSAAVNKIEITDVHGEKVQK